MSIRVVVLFFTDRYGVFARVLRVLSKVVEKYDPECRTMQKRLVMEKSSYSMQMQCTNEACIAALAAIPVEAIVVGSVVVVGNTILWLKKVGNCR